MKEKILKTGSSMIWRRSFCYFVTALFFVIPISLYAMVEDSRFFPWYPRNLSRTCDRPSAVFFDGMLITGNDAFSNEDETDMALKTRNDEDDIGIYEIFGAYDETKLVNAMVAAGFENPYDLFPSLDRFNNLDVIWNMHGKIQAQGITFQWDQNIWRYFSVGGSCFFMHLYARNAFELNNSTVTMLQITAEDQVRLDQVRRVMNDQLGLKAPVYKKTGFSDIDFYIRVGNIWNYFCKFRRIDGGLKIGTMIPTGLVRNVRNTVSVPFGGDGHWGIYGAVDAEFELKEDWKVGMHARVNKRFAKNKVERMPVLQEQQLFGVVQGRAKINPGITVIVSPYGRLENIREGFGLQIGYTIAHHMKDNWVDERLVKSPPVNLEENIRRSTWTSEYVTVDAFFDCSHICFPHWFTPIVSFKWDVPIKFFAAKNAVKTNRIMLGVALNY